MQWAKHLPLDSSLHLSICCYICLPPPKKKKNKNRETSVWIAVYGTLQKFFTDNGGEFANSKSLEMVDQPGITIHTTAAESPSSNRVVQRNIQILAHTMDKVIAETNTYPYLALTLALMQKTAFRMLLASNCSNQFQVPIPSYQTPCQTSYLHYQ